MPTAVPALGAWNCFVSASGWRIVLAEMHVFLCLSYQQSDCEMYQLAPVSLARLWPVLNLEVFYTEKLTMSKRSMRSSHVGCCCCEHEIFEVTSHCRMSSAGS